MKKNIDQIDKKVTDWMKFHGDTILRYAVALIFIWFGTLKIVGSSPAGELVAQTVYWFSPTCSFHFSGCGKSV
jgi:uncharacterized membrane protein YkgB